MASTPVSMWHRFAPPEAPFSVELPSEPVLKEGSEEHPILGVMHEAVAKTETLACKVQYSQLKKVPRPDYAMDFLRQVVSEPPGTRSRPVAWAGLSGLEVIGPGFIARAFVAGTHLVVLMVLATGEKPNGADAQRFVESLTFAPQMPEMPQA